MNLYDTFYSLLIYNTEAVINDALNIIIQIYEIILTYTNRVKSSKPLLPLTLCHVILSVYTTFVSFNISCIFTK